MVTIELKTLLSKQLISIYKTNKEYNMNTTEQVTNQSVPYVIESTPGGERTYDLASKMLESRLIVLDSDFNSQMAHIMKLQLLYLDSVNTNPITLMITSPGGSVHDGLGIADVVSNLRSPVVTVVLGMAASMGCYMQSVLGTPGMRFAGKRAQIMAHQVSSGTQGTLADQEVSLAHSKHLDKLLASEIADAVGVSYEQYKLDTARDLWLTAEAALNYGEKGFIDGIYLGKRNEKGQYLVQRRGGVEEWV